MTGFHYYELDRGKNSYCIKTLPYNILHPIPSVLGLEGLEKVNDGF